MKETFLVPHVVKSGNLYRCARDEKQNEIRISCKKFDRYVATRWLFARRVRELVTDATQCWIELNVSHLRAKAAPGTAGPHSLHDTTRDRKGSRRTFTQNRLKRTFENG